VGALIGSVGIAVVGDCLQDATSEWLVMTCRLAAAEILAIGADRPGDRSTDRLMTARLSGVMPPPFVAEGRRPL
jgi:hypothetical protein